MLCASVTPLTHPVISHSFPPSFTYPLTHLLITTPTLPALPQALSSTPTKLEKDVASLITRGQLPARIDSHTKTLHRTQQEVRSATVDRVLKVSQRHLGEIKRGILRLSVLQHGLQVPSANPSTREGRDPSVISQQRTGGNSSSSSSSGGHPHLGDHHHQGMMDMDIDDGRY